MKDVKRFPSARSIAFRVRTERAGVKGGLKGSGLTAEDSGGNTDDPMTTSDPVRMLSATGLIEAAGGRVAILLVSILPR